MKIELGKHYRTRDGREVRVYAVDGGGHYPVHGAYLSENGWMSCIWRANGFLCEGCRDDLDLIEVKPRIQRKVWVNVYRETAFGYPNRAWADNHAGEASERIACVEIDIDVEEGHGL